MYTEGPWKFEQDDETGNPEIYANSGYYGVTNICTVWNNWTANARLIAAAPELLKACKAAEFALTAKEANNYYMMNMERVTIPEARAWAIENPTPVIMAIRAAIAKAEQNG